MFMFVCVPDVRKERTTGISTRTCAADCGTALAAEPENHEPMTSSMKKTARKTATKKSAARSPAKKKVSVRGAAPKATKTSAKATGKKAAVRSVRPVAKSKRPARPLAKATKPTKPLTVRKATPDKKARLMEPRTALPIERPAAGDRPKAKLREHGPAKPSARPLTDAEAHTAPDVQLPAATFDPTPDTNVPLRGQTSFQHNAQSERAAALKGQRARMGNRRKH